MDTSHGRYPGWAPSQVGPVFREAVWPSPAAVRARVVSGLGWVGQSGEVDIEGGSLPTGGGGSGWLTDFQAIFSAGAGLTRDILRLRPPAGVYQTTAIDPRTG